MLSAFKEYAGGWADQNDQKNREIYFEWIIKFILAHVITKSVDSEFRAFWLDLI